MTRPSYEDVPQTGYAASTHSHLSHLSSMESSTHLNQQIHDNGRQSRGTSVRNLPPSGSDSTIRPSHLHQQYPSDQDAGELTPPALPFAYAQAPGVPRSPSIASEARSTKTNSLSVNYVPIKFAKPHEAGVWQHRMQKQGGGREAFADDADRMGEGAPTPQLGKGNKKVKLRWNRFKWALFVANTVCFLYGLAGLILALLVWFDIFFRSDVVRVGNRTELILSTTAASLIVFTTLIGFAGIILNNRPFLAVYTLLLWVCLAFILAPGYMTYKQRTFNLEGKINAQWSRDLGLRGRLRVQNALTCCGYYSPFVEATTSNLCYARSILPGCKGKYLRFERDVLKYWYIASFSLVPLQIAVIITSLLSSSHITYRFGKGLTPKRYRLDTQAMNVLMEEYSSQIAGMYGPAVAQEAVNRSGSNLSLNEKNSYAQPDSQGLSTGVSSLSTATHRNPATNHRDPFAG